MEAQPFMGERSMGEIQVYLNPRQGRPGSIKSSILAFLRVEILQVGTTWYPLGLHTKAFPDAQRLWKGTESRDQAHRDEVQGEEGCRQGEQAPGTFLFSGSIFFPPLPNL